MLVDLEAFVKKFEHFSAIKMGLGTVVPFGFALVAQGEVGVAFDRL